MADARWKVGSTQPTTYSASLRYGYSFAIQNFRGAPLLNVTFATKEESEQAEAAVRKAIENAVDIMGYNGS
jgi:hypothetical protein